ncbi:MAG TPA: DinB family protein [Chryseosolibacter sp.]
MDAVNLSNEFHEELESEVKATRRCLEAIPHRLYDFKPHEKSMNLGYLSLLVADIPRWITYSIEKGEVDFATYPQFKLATTEALLQFFDANVEDAKSSLKKMQASVWDKTFFLKNSGKVLYSAPMKENIRSTLNHWVHHRGQLTVYMRLNDIAVPSIYGPSADEKVF